MNLVTSLQDGGNFVAEKGKIFVAVMISFKSRMIPKIRVVLDLYNMQFSTLGDDQEDLLEKKIEEQKSQDVVYEIAGN